MANQQWKKRGDANTYTHLNILRMKRAFLDNIKFIFHYYLQAIICTSIICLVKKWKTADTSFKVMPISSMSSYRVGVMKFGPNSKFYLPFRFHPPIFVDFFAVINND